MHAALSTRINTTERNDAMGIVQPDNQDGGGATIKMRH